MTHVLTLQTLDTVITDAIDGCTSQASCQSQVSCISRRSKGKVLAL